MNASTPVTTYISQFLSCLLGSEQLADLLCGIDVFLSCLLGSEPVMAESLDYGNFLSCLLGSERAGM